MNVVNIPGIEVTDYEALQNWLDSDEHMDCAANNEGLSCCLDKLVEAK